MGNGIKIRMYSYFVLGYSNNVFKVAHIRDTCYSDMVFHMAKCVWDGFPYM
jgi:hypothetical protein